MPNRKFGALKLHTVYILTEVSYNAKWMEKKGSIAVTKNGKDFIRIKPISAKSDKTEIKFLFMTPSFRIRKFEESKENGLLRYLPTDCGTAKHEITYHNANNTINPALIPKFKNFKNPNFESNFRIES